MLGILIKEIVFLRIYIIVSMQHFGVEETIEKVEVGHLRTMEKLVDINAAAYASEYQISYLDSIIRLSEIIKQAILCNYRKR